MTWTLNDGGRAAAGYRGSTGDCGARALAIATEMTYREAYDLINRYARDEKPSKRRRGKSNARTGVHTPLMRKLMADLGWTWVPTMRIGSGTTVHLRADELPEGRLLVCCSKHYTAVIDGVVHDTYDPTRGGTRAVYGYYYLAG